MSRFTFTSLLLLAAALSCSAQSKFDPSQIKWPTGAAGCFFQPATDTCAGIIGVGANGIVETGDYTTDGTIPFIQMNCASPCTLTLPSTIATGFAVAIERTGAGSVTIDPNGLTYDGATSIPLQYEFVMVWTVGSVYHSNSPLNIDSTLSWTPGAGSNLLSAAPSSTSLPLCADTSGSGTAQSCATSPTFTPSSGSVIRYSTTTANTGDVTVNVNSLGAKHIRKWLGSAVLAAGDLPANIPLILIYDGTYWETPVIGNAPSGGLADPGNNGIVDRTASGVTTRATAQMMAVPLVCPDSSGSPTAQSCSTTPTSPYTAGTCITYTTTTANTGTGLTINVNGYGAVSVAKWGGSTTTLAGGDIPNGKPIPMCYDGTNWDAMTIGNAPTPGSGGAMVQLGQVTVSGSTTSNITFSTISGSYSSLRVICSLQSNTGGLDALYLQVNGDTGSNYDYGYVLGGYSGNGHAAASSATLIHIGGLSSTMVTSYPSPLDLTIPGYAGTTFYKSFTATSARNNDSSGDLDTWQSAGVWRNTAAITSLKFVPAAATYFVAGSQCTLYGLQ